MSSPKTKKVRQTKVAGPVISYAFPPPRGEGVVLALRLMF
jgi:hypothetical protein